MFGGQGELQQELHTGAVLEIALSSFQTACCRWLLQCTYGGIFTKRFQWCCNTNFCEGLSWQPKKGSSLDFLSFDSKQKPVTLLFSTLCMSRETLYVAEKGRNHRWGTNPEWVSGNLRNPSKTAPDYIHGQTKWKPCILSESKFVPTKSYVA